MVRMIFLEHGVINYSWSADYFAWMLANEDTLRNLRNRRYWADQMTPEDYEARRASANRSYNWIPNRILRVRDEAEDEQMEWLFGPDGWTKKWAYEGPCMRCKVDIKRLKDYQNEVYRTTNERANAWVDKNPSKALGRDDLNRGFMPKEMWYDLRDRVVSEVNRNYTDDEIEKSEIRLPDWKEMTYMSSVKGFCPQCYYEHVEPQLGWDSRLDNYK